MADRTRDDPYGMDETVVTPIISGGVAGGATSATSPVGVAAGAAEAPLPGRTRDTFTDTPTATPTTPTGLPGSPLDPVWGVDSESYLTDEQRKLMRQIQGKFDASMQRRDRELARWGAPMLSSYVNDEALARAIAAAQGLNYREDVPPEELTLPPWYNQPSGSGGAPRLPTTTGGAPRAAPDTNEFAKWQQILGGLTSLAPILFGKNAWGEFINKGLLQTAKNWIFGENAPYISDYTFENIVKTGALPTDATGNIVFNPITGLPLMINPDSGSGSSVDYGDPWGPDSGWGQDVVSGGWEGGDWGVPDTSSWWDFSGGTGGDYVDLFGGV